MTLNQQNEPLAGYRNELATALVLLELMRMRSSSISLNWDEDTDLWECSVISGGERLVALGDDIPQVVNALIRKIRDER